MKTEFKIVGKVTAAHGIKGEIFIYIFSKDTSWAKQDIEFMLTGKLKSELIYKINKFRVHKEGLIVSTELIKDRNLAESLIGSEFSVSAQYFNSKDGEALFLSEINGFVVIDDKMGEIGSIIGFSSNGVQDLLIVENQVASSVFFGKQFEIPFVKQFVIQIDHQLKIINTALPEGLLEINQ